MKVKVKYFGILKDITGVPEETLVTNTATIEELLRSLAARYPLLAQHIESVRVALNGRLVDKSNSVENDGEIALLPPVSGG